MSARKQRGSALARAVLRPLSDGLNLAEHLLAGAAATGVAVLSMHPLDTVKTVMQTGVGRGQGVVGASASVVRAGGVRGLYRGVGASVGGQVPAGAIKFAAFEGLSQWVRGRGVEGPAVDFGCAALAFVVCSIVLVPGEVVKQRMQAGVYTGILQGVRQLMRVEGLRGFYTGYRATLLRDVPYTMLEFGLYAQAKKLARVVKGTSKLTPQEEWTLGGIAGGCTGFLTTPLDLAKTRLMTQGRAMDAAVRYKGVVDVLTRVAKTEGARGLFRGSSARVAWLIPFTAVFFGVHEASKRALLDRKPVDATAFSAKKST